MAIKKDHKFILIGYVIGVLFPPRVFTGLFSGGLGRASQTANVGGGRGGGN